MLQEFTDLIVQFAIGNIVWLAPLATVLTSLLKRYIPASTISATTLNTVIILVVFSGVMVADRFQYLEQLNNIMNAVVAFLTVITGSLLGSAGLYKFARFTDTPFLQYSRGQYESNATQ